MLLIRGFCGDYIRKSHQICCPNIWPSSLSLARCALRSIGTARAKNSSFGDGFVAEVLQLVLYVYGSQDFPFFVRPEVRALQTRFVTGLYREVEIDAGHWMMQEKTEQVVEAVMAHLREQTKSTSGESPAGK
ncbi:MAG: alpha/beta hydrolase [Pseudomonadales bacterium]